MMIYSLLLRHISQNIPILLAETRDDLIVISNLSFILLQLIRNQIHERRLASAIRTQYTVYSRGELGTEAI